MILHRPSLGDSPECFLISSRQQWLPGNYASAAAARYAFQFPDAVLLALQERINYVGGESRPITTEDLRAARAAAAGPAMRG